MSSNTPNLAGEFTLAGGNEEFGQISLDALRANWSHLSHIENVISGHTNADIDQLVKATGSQGLAP